MTHAHPPLFTSLRAALLASLSLLGCDAKDDEGEPCPEAHATQPCSEGDQEGRAVCVPAATAEEPDVWSQCLVETCREHGKTRPCGAEGGEAVQHCIQLPDDMGLYWGRCAVDVCHAGETNCSTRQDCVVDESGATRWRDIGGGWSDECDTPLVLSFGAQEPEFQPAPVRAAAFDISGAGRCTAHDWPTAATPWLVRDLDRSGDIEGGHELFGSGTVLASGRRASHGFEALAELDADGDRTITAADAAWSELLVWSDHDGDRVASGWELAPLAAYGVQALPLGHDVSPVCDERGNCGRERASFTSAAGVGQLVDVHLVCE